MRGLYDLQRFEKKQVQFLSIKFHLSRKTGPVIEEPKRIAKAKYIADVVNVAAIVPRGIVF